MKNLIFILLLVQVTANAQNFRLIHSKVSLCNEEIENKKHKNEVLDERLKNGTYFLLIGVTSNCYNLKNISVNYTNDTLLILHKNYIERIDTIISNDTLFFDISKMYAVCYCSYIAEFSITGLKKIPMYIVINGKKINNRLSSIDRKFEKFELKNKDTINGFDKYGRKQGVWIENNKSGLKKKLYYINDFIFKGNIQIWSSDELIKSTLIDSFFQIKEIRYSSKQIEEIKISNGRSTFRQIFKNGIKEREYIELDYINRIENNQIVDNKTHITKIFYPDGKLKAEFYSSDLYHNPETIYYYPDGKVMAIKYYFLQMLPPQRFIEKYYDKNENYLYRQVEIQLKTIKTQWFYFNQNGEYIDKESLIRQGYEFYN